MNRRVALSVALLLAGCEPAPLTTFAPKSDLATRIVTVYWEIVGWDSLILLVVIAVFLLGVFRYSGRATKGIEPPHPTHSHLGLEVAWTVGPALVILAIAIPTIRLNFQSQASRPTAGAFNVRVISHQWWWEFQYPELGITTANEMHLPVGQPVQFRLESADVIHSFWVPQLGGKIDVIPGHVNHTWFQVDQAGTYHGQCAEFCGIQHADMRMSVIAQSEADFQAWVKQQQAPPAAATGDAAQGQQVFMTGACIGCHTINGTNARGTVGPNLTHFASHGEFAGAMLENTPQNLTRWLTDPQAVKQGTLMPNLHLPADQISALVAYLESLK